MFSRTGRHFGFGLFTLAVMTSLPSAHAASLSMVYDFEFSGGRAPGGTGPWIWTAFDDSGSTGTVRMTVSAAGLTSGENIKELYFNIDPSLDPTKLSFNYLSSSSTAAAANTISLAPDAYKADGDGLYDIKLDFKNGSGFDAGELLVYDITGITTLSASSFMFLSKPAGGHGPYYAAANVQNTTGLGTGNGGWIAPSEVTIAPVPLPAAGWLLGSGLMMMAALKRKYS